MTNSLFETLFVLSYGEERFRPIKDGSRPIEIFDTSWTPSRAPSAREIATRNELKELDRRVKLHGAESIEGLTPEMITFEADLSWRDALDPGIPSREELELMAEDAQATDEVSLAIRYLDPPRNTVS